MCEGGTTATRNITPQNLPTHRSSTNGIYWAYYCLVKMKIIQIALEQIQHEMDDSKLIQDSFPELYSLLQNLALKMALCTYSSVGRQAKW